MFTNTMKPLKIQHREEKNADEEENKKFDRDFINLLANECLVKCFKYLSIFERLQIEKVCTRWEAVSKLAWSDIREFDCTWNDKSDGKPMTQSDVQLVLQRCGFYLRKLVLPEIRNSSIMPYVTEYCPNLTNIELQLIDISRSDFVDAFSSMTRLKVIKITKTRYYLDNPVNYSEILESLPEGMLEIHILSTKGMIYFSSFQYSTLERFTSLHSLSLHDFSLNSTTCQQIAQKITLINLDLTGCSLNQPFSISSLINLERLNLERLGQFDEGHSAVIIANGCKKLKYLNIADSNRLISDVTLQEIAELKNLEHLIINNVSKVEDSLFNGFFKLKVLECSDCTNVTDIGIMKILKNCSMLERLNIFKTSITSETLFYAVEVTKSRQNHVVLEISAYSSVVAAFNEMERDVSSFLTVISIDDGEYDYYSNDYDHYVNDYHSDHYFDDHDDIDDYNYYYYPCYRQRYFY